MSKKFLSVALALTLALTCILPAMAEEASGVTLHWFERELYQAGFEEFSLEVRSELLLDTRDYILVLRIETLERAFIKVINAEDFLGIKEGYFLFDLEWAEDFMSEIRSCQNN